MKTFVPAASVAAMLLLFLMPAGAQTKGSPKRLYDALGCKDLKTALVIAQGIDDVNYCNKYGASLLMCASEKIGRAHV